MLQPTSEQQVPTNYVIAPMQHHMIPPIHNYPSGDYTSQKSQRITSTSEEEEEKKYQQKWMASDKTHWKEENTQNTKQYNTSETKIATDKLYGLLTNETC